MSASQTISIPDQSGRTVVVTGANSGLGFETAKRLAGAGAHVVLACRDLGRGNDAAGRIVGDTEVRRLDTSSLASVQAFAHDYDGPVDVLINNAGIMAIDETRSVDGFELQFATNYLGAFALTVLLLPRVTDRVVMLSSLAHRVGRIAIDDLNWRRRRYGRWGAYGQSKLADLMFAFELQSRLSAAGSTVRAFAAHPGMSSTGLTAGMHMPPAVEAASTAIIGGLGQPPAAGALPTLYAATARDLPGGSYVGPSSLGELKGTPMIAQTSRAARNRGMQRLLTTESERLTGVTLPV